MKTKRTKPTTTLKPQPAAQFIYTDPTAKTVAIAGTFTDWAPTPMTANPNGTWSKALPLTPGTYEYRFIVDGTWTDDPRATATAPNPFGTKNSILQIVQP